MNADISAWLSESPKKEKQVGHLLSITENGLSYECLAYRYAMFHLRNFRDVFFLYMKWLSSH
jgi:hypothetical protein